MKRMPGSVGLKFVMSDDQDKTDDTSLPCGQVSLGSLSLTATGEQLDDISVNLDRMYLESPAPNSLTSGNFERGTPATSEVSRLNTGRPPPPSNNSGYNLKTFDDIELLEMTDVSEAIDPEDWLCDLPGALPESFSHDDRSFLDTNLMNTRFSLLNYVTRAINEETFAENNQRYATSSASHSNLANEAAGSGATFKVTRPVSKIQSGKLRSGPLGATNPGHLEARQAGAGAFRSSFEEDEDVISDEYESASEDPPEENGAAPPVHQVHNEAPVGNSFVADASERRKALMKIRQSRIQEPVATADHSFNNHDGTLTYRRPKPPSRESIHNLPNIGDSFVVTSPSKHLNNQRRLSSGSGGFGDATIVRGTTFASDHNGFGYPETDDFVPEGISPIRQMGSSRKPTPGGKNGMPGIPGNFDDTNGYTDPGSDDLSGGSGGSFSREIDTRTYTRPKKSRMSIAGPNRHLTTTLSLSHQMALGISNGSSQAPINTTIDLSPDASPVKGISPLRQLNTTVSLSPERSPTRGSPHTLNTTVNADGRHASIGAAASPSTNLNETFVTDNDDSQTERSRRVTRNLSYVIRQDAESPNNNSSSRGHNESTLNTTFSFEGDGDVEMSATRSSQNTSMEDLNSRVASQIRSLGCSTISRGTRVSDSGLGRAVPNLEEARLIARTSSTDTYSVAHSSESPTSSGLSSPMDAQSYDDIQTSDAVRRSMPNLAVMRSANPMRSNLAFPQVGVGQLRKNHYISDSRLSRVGTTDRPRLSLHPSESSNGGTFSRGFRPSTGVRARGVDRNTSTPASLNRISSVGPQNASRVYSAQALGPPQSRTSISRMPPPTARSQGSMGNVRSTGIGGARYSATTSSSTGSLRPPRPTSSASQPSVAQRAPGIPVPTFRSQSRIPGPGQLRFSRPPAPVSKTGIQRNMGMTQRNPEDDWRDGCY